VEAARDLGLPEVTILDAGPAPVSMSEGAHTIAALGAAVSRFDAIVCVSDPVAFGALTACQSLGLDVPRDIAITGFGAFEIASICRPALTTVDVGAADIGRAAGRHIALRLRMQEGRHAEVDLRTSVRFIEGQSS
jgi:LacI family gluconate utilization system Gnt-I transcriptional repressor